MAKQERLVGVNGPLTPWQAGAGQQTEDRNADRALALRQQEMARRDQEKQALMQGLMTLFQAQESRNAQASQQGFQSQEADAARSFTGGQNATDRAMREREALQGQANADRAFGQGEKAFTEGQSQFDRNLQAQWAGNQLEAQARMAGGKDGKGSAEARQASATAALQFLENDDIKSGRPGEMLADDFVKLQILDPEAAELVRNYLGSPQYKAVMEKSAGQRGVMDLDENSRQVRTNRLRSAHANLQKVFNVPKGGAAAPGAAPQTDFLQRPVAQAPEADPRAPETMLADLYSARSQTPERQAIRERQALMSMGGSPVSPEIRAMREGDRTPRALDGLARSAELRGRMSVRPSFDGQAGPAANLDRMVDPGFDDVRMARQALLGSGSPLDHVPPPQSPFPLMQPPDQTQHFGGLSLPTQDWRRPTPRRVR